MTATTYSTRGSSESKSSRRRRVATDASRIGVRAVVVGAAIAAIVAGWPLPVGTTLIFGVAVLLWVLASMAREEPGA